MTDAASAAVFASVISALAALGGAFGSQWFAQRAQRAQHEHDLVLAKHRADSDQAEALRQRRQSAYEDFLSATAEILLCAVTQPSNTYPHDVLQRMLTAHARIDIIATEQVRVSARKLRASNYAVAQELRAPTAGSRDAANALPRIRGDFLRAVRTELGLPYLSPDSDETTLSVPG